MTLICKSIDDEKFQRFYNSIYRELVSKRTEFLSTMIKGNKLVHEISKVKEQTAPEEDKFSLDNLKTWAMDILNPDQEKLDKEHEEKEKKNTENFNRRQMAAMRRETGKVLASESNVKSFLDFRRKNLQDTTQTNR